MCKFHIADKEGAMFVRLVGSIISLSRPPVSIHGVSNEPQTLTRNE